MMKPEPGATALRCGWGCWPLLNWLKKSRNGAGRLSVSQVAVGGRGLDGDGDHGGAHALDQVGEAEGRAVFQHARRARACIGVVGGDHGRAGPRSGWRAPAATAQRRQGPHDDGGGATHGGQAALAQAGLGEAGQNARNRSEFLGSSCIGRLLGNGLSGPAVADSY